MIYNNITELVGKTPLVQMNELQKLFGTDCSIYAKLEMFNPLSSVKDRAGLNMIKEGEKNGLINKDTVIIEPTSGNTGVALAFICAQRGYKLILTMPETMSVERRNIVKALGATLVLTDGKLGMNGAIQKAKELSSEYPNHFIPQQFENEANPKMHYETTAPEIYNDTNGDIDIFVATAGTGGTISGVSKYLKEKNPNIKVIVVEPSASNVISGGSPAPHKIQGIGPGFVPKNLDTNLIDEIITIDDEDAFKYAKLIAKNEGILCGISSGAAMCAVNMVANREENKGKKIVTVLPDTGERYLSNPLFI